MTQVVVAVVKQNEINETRYSPFVYDARVCSTHKGDFISNSLFSSTRATYNAAAAKPAWSLSSESRELYSSAAFFIISSAFHFVFF